MHEVTESYEGEKISQKSGTSSPRAGIEGSGYESAHNKATGQSTITQRMFDAQGKEVFDTNKAVRVEWSVSKGGKERVIQTFP